MLSVVITCYNLESYVGQAIESVLAQRGAGEFEIIVVDDCSTDASREVIQRFPSVRYLPMAQNSGVMLAMLAGIEAANGDVICLLDGDDLWEPNKLAATQAVFESDQDIALVTHDLRFIDGAGRPIAQESLPSRKLGQLSAEHRGERVRKGILEVDDYVWLGSAMSFRRSLVDWPIFAAWVNALPDPGNTYQDWPLAYWIAARPTVKLAYIDEPLFRYRLHQANHSGDARTTDRAIRNFGRMRNTMASMADIAEREGLEPRLQRIASERASFGEALVSLYRGRRGAAIAGLIPVLPMLWREKRMAKEILRFVVATVIGPDRFTRLLAALR